MEGRTDEEIAQSIKQRALVLCNVTRELNYDIIKMERHNPPIVTIKNVNLTLDFDDSGYWKLIVQVHGGNLRLPRDLPHGLSEFFSTGLLYSTTRPALEEMDEMLKKRLAYIASIFADAAK